MKQEDQYLMVATPNKLGVMSETTEVLTGSCLCGGVSYTVWAPFLRFAHCYCSRCRKATGTGHATNLYCSPQRFRWTSSEELISRYDLPFGPQLRHCHLPRLRLSAPTPHAKRARDRCPRWLFRY